MANLTLAQKTREHRRLLRAMGFKLMWRSRHQDGDCDCFEMRFADRTVDVQLWEDGGHRASHMYDTVYSKNGRCNTNPTNFDTPMQMLAAVGTEASRMDGVGSQQHA